MNNGWYVASVMAPTVGRVSKHVYQGWNPCIQWCSEYFNNTNDQWRFVGEGVFEFRNEKDYMWFLLRWGT
jgi:hypothetical protein